jgi:hypothetical protein
MLKLIKKASAGAALTAAIAMGSNAAFATLTFTLSTTPTEGGTSATVVQGSGPVTLYLFADITSAGVNGIYDVGGSFSATGPGTVGETQGFTNAYVSTQNTSFSTPGSESNGGGSVNVVYNNSVTGGATPFDNLGASGGSAQGPTYWGSTNSYATASTFFYDRSGATSSTGGTITPVLGNHLFLGEVRYSPAATDLGAITISFVPRSRPGTASQIWQQNGVAIDDTTGTIATSSVTLNVTTSGPVTSTWSSTSASTWETPGNWTPSASPSGPDNGAAVVVGTSNASTSITVNGSHTVNSIAFNTATSSNDGGLGAGNYNIQGAGTLTFSAVGGGGGGTATLSATGGTHTISTNISVASGTLVQATGNGTIVLGDPNGVKALNFSAASGLVVGTGSDAPVLQFAQLNSGVVRQTAPVLVTLNGLTINSGATLDITNHDLLIHNGNLAQITAYITAAYDTAGWDLPGLTSSTASNAGNTTLAVASGTEFINNYDGNSYDNQGNPLFDGSEVLPTDVLVKYTYDGDLTFDGQVTSDDLSQFLGNYIARLHPADYEDGDLAYEGSVGSDALSTFLGPYISRLGDSSPLGSLGNPVQVPEPASLALLGMGTLALLGRRRK